MSRRVSVIAAALLVFAMSPWFNRTASAQDTLLNHAEATMLFITSNAAAAESPAVDPRIPYDVVHGRSEQHGSKALLPLYAGVAALQILDVHSTLTAMRYGAREGNPLMTGPTSTTMGFLALKAGVATSTILAAKSMAKHNKPAAIAMLIGVNTGYALIVAHNYRLAHGLQ